MRAVVGAFVLGLAFVPQSAAAQGQQKSPPTRDEIFVAARAIIQKARFATFATVGEKGEPESRIVDAFAPDSSFTVWVATKPLTRKVAQIRRDPRVNLLWFDSGSSGYVALSGRATLVPDAAEKERHWKDEWAALYDNRNHGDDYLLIRVTPLHMEIVSFAAGIVGDPKTWLPVMLDFPSSAPARLDTGRKTR
ncbi:MAG TPA: pyridoxamine 5'-phosphate oxidase family protein [Gemmatimonadaceae bacterium]